MILGYPNQPAFAIPQAQAGLKSSTSGPILQQQQILLTQQMQQMQQLQQQQQMNSSVQYVQLSNGLLVPTTNITTIAANPVDISASLQQSQMVAATNQQLQQQQLQISQQLQQAQNKKQPQTQQVQKIEGITNCNQVSYSISIMRQKTPFIIHFTILIPETNQTRTGKEATKEIPNSQKAQMEQVDLSNDVGMKCSQI